MIRSRKLAALAAMALAVSAATLACAQSPDVAFGRRVAQRNCGGCHAVAGGRSPNPDSPPFRRLYRRYGPGGLDALLAEGMLAPTDRSEEGGRPYHPRMPQVRLDEDEAAALKAYLKSLEPRRER
jgi:mono/diheme cytochrome c family protein